jgi:hypothetical protein
MRRTLTQGFALRGRFSKRQITGAAEAAVPGGAAQCIALHRQARAWQRQAQVLQGAVI